MDEDGPEALDDPAFRELRAAFLRDWKERLDAVSRLLESLAGSSGGDAILEELSRHFHNFAGLGTMCGFPDVSAIGREGEVACNGFLSEGSAPARSDLERWGTLLSALRAQFERAEREKPSDAG